MFDLVRKIIKKAMWKVVDKTQKQREKSRTTLDPKEYDFSGISGEGKDKSERNPATGVECGCVN